MTNPTSKTPLLPVVRVLVWDAPLRVCHALMVACFTGTYLTGEQEEWRKVHATLGCTLGGLMVFRIIWGFVGTRYARFTNFLEAPGGIAKQLRQLPHGLAQRHIGLSPVGTLCYVILLLSMIGVGASGWATSGAAADDWLNALHEVAANVTLAVGGLYIAGVALSSWRAGDSPVLSHDPWNQAGLARRGHAKRETEWPCCWWQRLLPSGGINGRTSPRPVLQPPVTSPIPSRPRPKSAAGNTATILRRANTPGAERHILCMKWGTKYGPEYVNRLYAMVRRHLSGDFRFVCLTDDAQGIRPEVQCLPIPPLDLPAGIPERGWTKLVTFSADLHGLRGTALFLDVDVVIVGSLDAFFEHLTCSRIFVPA